MGKVPESTIMNSSGLFAPISDLLIACGIFHSWKTVVTEGLHEYTRYKGSL